MSLKRIPRDVEKKISASSDNKSFTKAIEELVYNAFDAKSTSIAVRVFIQEGSIQVIDNGIGISGKDFKFLGHRYYTSKFRSDINSECYGYRGLSLASIVEVSQKVRITSRHHDNAECTYTKTFIEGKEQDFNETSTRPSKGTTVDVTGFLWNFHIQKDSINVTNEMSRIKTFLERISLAHCNTSISLRDDSINEIIFQINKHRDITQTLQTLYQIRSQDIQELQVEKNEYKIHGFLEKTVEGDKNYHFIYVNGRFIRNSKLQSSIDKRLKNNNYNRVTKRKHVFDDAEKATSKNTPFYFIFIKCPYKDYDVSHSNEETFIEFKNWDTIDKLVEKLIKFYKGDLKVKEISKSACKKISQVTNGDTRKQVRQIMQRILDNSAKKPKRLRLRTGIIGKNVTRKDNKKSEKLSISKIVSKQFKSRFHEFYTKNPPQSKYNSTINRQQLLIENNKEKYSEKEEINNDNSTQNQVNNKNVQIKSKYMRPSQESLNKRFKNPTDTILQRCNLQLDGLKEYLVPKKAIDYSSRETVNTQIDVRFKNHDIVTKKKGFIKTSHDLIKTIYDSQIFNLSSAKDYKRETIVKNFVKNTHTVKKYSNQKMIFETVKYSKESPPRKRKRFISEKSCSNFHTSKTLRTVLHGSEQKKKDTRKKKQGVKKQKTKVAKLLHKNMYTGQSIHTIETFESHFRNKVGSNFESFGDTSYRSHRGHRFINETLASKINNYDARGASNTERVTKYDFHKTFTIEISESKNCYSQVNKRQYQKTNNNNKSDIFSNLTLDEVFSESDDLFMNTKLSCYKTALRNSIFVSRDFGGDFYGNVVMKSHNDVSPQYENDALIQYSVNEDNLSVDLDYITAINNMHINRTCTTYVDNHHKAINPISVYETLFQDNPFDKFYVFEDNLNEKVSIKSKEDFIPRHDDYILQNSLNKENSSSLSLDNNAIITDLNTNTKETSPSCLKAKLNLTNPLSIFEVELKNCALEDNVFGKDWYDNISIQDIKNFSSEENINSIGTILYDTGKNNDGGRLRRDLIEKININEESKILSEQNIKVTTDKRSLLELHVNNEFPIETNEFKMNRRHSFIPKGMSQITEIQYRKTPHLAELQESYYNTNIYDNFASHLQTFSEVLEPGVQILHDLDVKGIRHVIKPSCNDPIFDDNCLNDAKVLGQVDNKFIGAKVTGRYPKINTKSEFLVLFDQHAVDERIQLETNLADYFDDNAWTSVPIDILQLKLSKDVKTYLHNYKEKFTRFGLDWACDDDVVSIRGIPKAILGKHFRQTDVIMKAVKSLILEEVKAIKSLKGNVFLYPKSIMDLVFSEACRYAIKFGDILRKSECENLLNALSKCKLPFQCAHGRPVMAVMMELSTASYEYKINMDNLKKIKPKLAKYSK